MKKTSIGSAIGLGVIIMLVIFFKIGVVIKSILNPPHIDPANQAYGKIPAIPFPQSTIKGDFTYSLDTLTGKLPEGFPDRLIVYPIVTKEPGLLDLDNARRKVAKLGLVNDAGTALPEIPRGGTMYEWKENKGFQRRILYDTVALNFTMTSNYIVSNTVLRADTKPNEISALATSQSFLTDIESLPDDLDLDKTRNPDPKADYTTKPQLFSISGNDLVPASSLADTQVVRVDLYQKNVAYKLTAGQDGNLTQFQDFDLNLPIMYPHPPYSTMNFLVASGDSANEVVSAIYNHQTVNLTPDKEATYPIKTAQEAFDELKAGKGYIASYKTLNNQVIVNNVYLAYFLGDIKQTYLMPVVVFEGENGFFGYVSAIKDEALQ